MGERAWKGTELDPANRPAVLTREEHDLMLAKQAAGVPLSAIAKLLGRPLSTLTRGVVIEDRYQADADARQAAWEREREERRQQRRQERERERANGPTTVWRAPKG